MKRKKITGLLAALAMVLMVLGTGSRYLKAASPATEVWVRGYEMISETGDPAMLPAGVSYDAGTNTLTLYGATVESVGPASMKKVGDSTAYATIWANGDLTIKLLGENTVRFDADLPDGGTNKAPIVITDGNLTVVNGNPSVPAVLTLNRDTTSASSDALLLYGGNEANAAGNLIFGANDAESNMSINIYGRTMAEAYNTGSASVFGTASIGQTTYVTVNSAMEVAGDGPAVYEDTDGTGPNLSGSYTILGGGDTPPPPTPEDVIFKSGNVPYAPPAADQDPATYTPIPGYVGETPVEEAARLEALLFVDGEMEFISYELTMIHDASLDYLEISGMPALNLLLDGNNTIYQKNGTEASDLSGNPATDTGDFASIILSPGSGLNISEPYVEGPPVDPARKTLFLPEGILGGYSVETGQDSTVILKIGTAVSPAQRGIMGWQDAPMEMFRGANFDLQDMEALDLEIYTQGIAFQNIRNIRADGTDIFAAANQGIGQGIGKISVSLGGSIKILHGEPTLPADPPITFTAEYFPTVTNAADLAVVNAFQDLIQQAPALFNDFDNETLEDDESRSLYSYNLYDNIPTADPLYEGSLEFHFQSTANYMVPLTYFIEDIFNGTFQVTGGKVYLGEILELPDQPPVFMYRVEGLSEVTVTLLPDYGYQYLKGSLKLFVGENEEDESSFQEITTAFGDQKASYRFTMPAGGGGIYATFVKTPDIIQEAADSLTGASLEMANPEINGNALLEISEPFTQAAISEEDLIAEAAGSKTVGTILDIRLKEFISRDQTLDTYEEDGWETEISQLDNPVTITLNLALEHRGHKDYEVVRIHEGVAEVLPATYDNGTLTFDTDSFSTYGILYTKSATPIVSVVQEMISNAGKKVYIHNPGDTKPEEGQKNPLPSTSVVMPAPKKDKAAEKDGGNLQTWAVVLGSTAAAGFAAWGIWYLAKRRKTL